MIVNKIWAFGETSQKLEVFEMDEKTMRIRITNDKIRDKVVRRGMWNIAGVPMVVTKWSPDVEDLYESLIPLWVHLTNVPMSMYSWEGLSFMTSDVGVPDHLYLETIACTNFDIAKIFVNADLSKELPQRIDFTIQGEKVTVDFAYPWLPPRCESCGKWGHYVTFCKKKDMKEDTKMEKTPESVSKSKSMETPKTAGITRMDQEGEIRRVGEKSDGIINKEVIAGSNEKSGEGKEKSSGSGSSAEVQEAMMEEGEINGWKTISGEKFGGSAKSQSLKYGQVTITTPSRYAALRNMDEKGEEIEKEQIDEVEDT